MRDQNVIAQECLEVEQSGGSVLEYLKSKGHISPRATWIRLQMNELGRKEDELTDGKTADSAKKGRCRNLTAEMKNKAIEIRMKGEDPRPYLATECGMQDPEAAWSRIKTWLQKSNPERYMELPKRLPRSTGWKNNTAIFIGKEGNKVDKGMPKKDKTPTVKVDGNLNIETPEVNMIQVTEVPEKQKITKPVNFGGFEVTAVRDRELEEFHYSRAVDFITWWGPDREEVSMSPDVWRKFIQRIPEIMGVLGVTV